MHLVFAQCQRHRHDDRAEGGDRELQGDVLPNVGKPNADDIALAHPARRKQRLNPTHVAEQLLEGDLGASLPDRRARAASRGIPLQVADGLVGERRHCINATIRSGVSGSVTSVIDSASAIALAIAAVPPMVPPSPTPWVPSSCTVDGMTRCSISTRGTSPTLGTR